MQVIKQPTGRELKRRMNLILKLVVHSAGKKIPLEILVDVHVQTHTPHRAVGPK